MAEFQEGHATNYPPYFDDTDYTYWKMRMKFYIQSVDYKCWERVKDGDYVPEVPKAEWTDLDKRELRRNALTIFLFHCALSREEFNKISTCTSGKEIQDKLAVTYEGTSRVKDTKVNLLVTQYEMFKME